MFRIFLDDKRELLGPWSVLRECVAGFLFSEMLGCWVGFWAVFWDWGLFWVFSRVL